MTGHNITLEVLRMHLTSNLLRASWLTQSYLVGHPAEQAERYADVLSLYTRVIELVPDNILAHLLQGRMLDVLEREEEAKAAYTRALDLARQALQKQSEDVHALVYQADALWMLGHGDEALQTYDKAIYQAPDCVEAYINKGWVLFVMNRHFEALQNYEEALRLQPDNADILYRKGCVLWEMRRYSEALRVANQAIALDPAQVRAYSLKLTTLSYMGLGGSEEAEQAEVDYQRLVSALKQQVLE
jgi:tetratricopeptide (TPR) repeat protein